MGQRLHILQHVPHEGPAIILNWAEEQGIALTYTYLYSDDYQFPALENFDALLVLGGPMGVYDELNWLSAEKQFIEQCISAGKSVLGICLGAQLIANVSGANVYPHTFKEVGWWPIHLTEQAKQDELFGHFEEEHTVLHWHGDTFDLPEGAVHFAYSEACAQQAFSMYNGRVIGLQYHIELEASSLTEWIKADAALFKLDEKYIQSASAIRKHAIEHIARLKKPLFILLNKWRAKW